MAAGELKGRATMVLVLGIASLFCCGLIGPIAWIKGNGVTA